MNAPHSPADSSRRFAATVRRAPILILLFAALCGCVQPNEVSAAEQAIKLPSPALDNALSEGPLQTAVLAGGCFWGVQGVFEHLSGVRRVVSGYSGGKQSTADYETVSGGQSGHAESVEITFDPHVVSYGQILQVFFSVAHDPTELNRQGPDSGTQYRSAIFYSDPRQREIALAYIAQLGKAGVFRRPVVTRVDALNGFYAAEDYHQDFLLNNPTNRYIVINDLPKIRNFERALPALYQPQAARLAAVER